jgi:hypothetical protein
MVSESRFQCAESRGLINGVPVGHHECVQRSLHFLRRRAKVHLAEFVIANSRPLFRLAHIDWRHASDRQRESTDV